MRGHVRCSVALCSHGSTMGTELLALLWMAKQAFISQFCDPEERGTAGGTRLKVEKRSDLRGQTQQGCGV